METTVIIKTSKKGRIIHEDQETQRKQNLFNRVWKHALRMTTQAKNDFGTCKYKVFDKVTGKVVNACLIGGTIPMSIYRASMEDKKAPFILEDFDTLSEYYGKHQLSTDEEFRSGIQRIHDYRFAQRENSLRELATTWGLLTPS